MRSYLASISFVGFLERFRMTYSLLFLLYTSNREQATVGELKYTLCGRVNHARLRSDV